jgi:type II secretory pathway predicted ATPase ExeA
MYTRFFALQHLPFSIAPDPRYLYMSERHREALAHLLYGVRGGGGFVLLTGEIGAGKTTICRLFLEQVPEQTNIAYIFNPKLTVIELLQSICDEFGIAVPQPVDGTTTVKQLINPLNAFLLNAHAQHQNNVLIIDEAQNLSSDVLEQLRLLTNLETNERKLLQIILIGQPELREILGRPDLEQLAQRVIARFHLGTLSLTETAQYIVHRLSVAGLQRDSPFTARATRRIYQHTRGVPRRINLLCDRALLGAYANGKRQVDMTTIDHAAREVFDFQKVVTTFHKVKWKNHVVSAIGMTLLSLVFVLCFGWFAHGSRLSQTTISKINQTLFGTSNVASFTVVKPVMSFDLTTAKPVEKRTSASSSTSTQTSVELPNKPLIQPVDPSALPALTKVETSNTEIVIHNAHPPKVGKQIRAKVSLAERRHTRHLSTSSTHLSTAVNPRVAPVVKTEITPPVALPVAPAAILNSLPVEKISVPEAPPSLKIDANSPQSLIGK